MVDTTQSSRYIIRDDMYRLLTLPWILLAISSSLSEGVIQPTLTNPRILEHPEDLYVARNDPATLNCKAEGSPVPIITWYRDGVQVTTTNDNPGSQRMLLPNGALFFLKVARGSKGASPPTGGEPSDVGTYYCNATNPTTGVSVISRNASLRIAVLREDFREQPPSSVEVAVGQIVTLQCRPPRGEPEPRVHWKKDNQPLRMTDNGRVEVSDLGSLTIKTARRGEDEGVYVCVASSVAGERESVPATLSVREKPVIVDGPKDTIVQESFDVVLLCLATGDPDPVIIWKKLEGTIPAERSQILSDRSLRIENAQISDDGIYVCRVENSVGWQEAEAKLTIHSKPSFAVTPRDKVVGVGRQVSIRCEVLGNPTPAVFWNKANSQTFMFPNQDNGRFRVSEGGSLIIDNVQRDDAGEYTCQALSLAGSAYAKARLEIKDTDPRPPPIIFVGPQNQTLPVAGVATLPCQATGDPLPAIYWLKDSINLPMSDHRFNILDSGTLEILDLRRSDTGTYTCKASSETGETSWAATLVVESQTNPSIIFHRTPEPTTFPGAPSRPLVLEMAETTIRLSWKPNIIQGASPVIGYTIEYFSHDTGEGWVIAASGVTEQSYVVRGLRPSTSYMFLVRAQNSHGLSLPSPVTAAVKTKGEVAIRARATVPPVNLSLVADKLQSAQTVNMFQPEALSSTALKLGWEIRRNQRFIEGFHIKYRIIADTTAPSSSSSASSSSLSISVGDSNPSRGHDSEISVKTVQSAVATTYVLTGLNKYTTYEIWAQAYYSTVEGIESNRVQGRTFEDVPSAAPSKVQGTWLTNDTLYLSWQPPSKQHWNGQLKGYKVYLHGNETKFDRTIQVNVSMETVQLRHLIKDMRYHVQMTAFTKMGEGVKSESFYIGHLPGEANQLLVAEPWFIATVIATIGAALWVTLCFLSVYIYRKHRTRKNKIKKCMTNGTAVQRHSEDTVREDNCTNAGIHQQQIRDLTAMRRLAGRRPAQLIALALCMPQKKRDTANSAKIKSCQPANQIPLLVSQGKGPSHYMNNGCRREPLFQTPCCYDNELPSDVDSKLNSSQITSGHTYQTLEPMNQQQVGGSCAQTKNITMATNTDQNYTSDKHTPTTVGFNRSPPVSAVPYASSTLVGRTRAAQPQNPSPHMLGGGTIPNPQAYMIQTPSCTDEPERRETNAHEIIPLVSQGNYSSQANQRLADWGERAYTSRHIQGCDGRPFYGPHGTENHTERFEDGSESQIDGLNYTDNFADVSSEARATDCDDSYVDAQRCATPDWGLTDTELADRDRTAWPNATDDEDASCSGSSNSATGELFAAHADFAGAVTRAAELSGLTVVGSIVVPTPPTRRAYQTYNPPTAEDTDEEDLRYRQQPRIRSYHQSNGFTHNRPLHSQSNGFVPSMMPTVNKCNPIAAFDISRTPVV